MKIANKYFFFTIYVEKNKQFFAEIDWLLYKFFGKRRSVPCGRSKKDDYLCCSQPLKTERVYFSEDKTECYCKVCGHLKALSNKPLDPEHIWGK